MSQGIAEGDRAAHAVAQQLDLGDAVPRPHAIDRGVEIGLDPLHPVDQRALAARAPVAAVIERVDRVARRHQPIDDVAVAAAMLGIAVGDDDDVARLARW